MTWAIPDWYALILLGLASFRLWRVLAEDDVLERPRLWVLVKAPWLETWLTCPWCSGAWIAVGWWLAWVCSPHWSLVISAPFAVSAILGLIATALDD